MARTPNRPKTPSPVAARFPADELSTGQTSALVRRARQVAGVMEVKASDTGPGPAVTTGRFLALKAAAEAARERPPAGPPRGRAAPKAPADTLAQRKMREAERNLPDWDFDDDDAG